MGFYDWDRNGNARIFKNHLTGIFAATDYFHTIPATTFLLGEYDPIQLDKVMIDSGKIYTAPQTSDTTGDVYSGDMRENVGKATFSTGINLANWGITSARLGSQEQPQLTQRRQC